MTSLAASIPPELFENILLFVGANIQRDTVTGPLDLTMRREEMQHLSVCAATCAHWAHLTRRRMFHHVVVESHESLCGLQSLLRDPSSSRRIDPIGSILAWLTLCYTLGDHAWFHSAAGLKAYGAQQLNFIILRINGPATPAFISANTRRPVLHPLSFSNPRILPMHVFHDIWIYVDIENIHLPSPAVLLNLLQDCRLLQPGLLRCENVTWDHDPEAASSTSSYSTFARILRKFEYTSFELQSIAVGCTDNALAVVIANSTPLHMISRGHHQVPHLSFKDTSCLLDVMRITTRNSKAGILVTAGPNEVRKTERKAEIMMLLPQALGANLFIMWRTRDSVNHCAIDFDCYTARLPHDTHDTHSVVCLAIGITQWPFKSATGSRSSTEYTYIDWDSDEFLRAVRRFPNLQQIFIECEHDGELSELECRKPMVEFVAQLGEDHVGLSSLLRLRCGLRRYNPAAGRYEVPHWSHVELESVLDDVRRMREEVKDPEKSENNCEVIVEGVSPVTAAP